MHLILISFSFIACMPIIVPDVMQKKVANPWSKQKTKTTHVFYAKFLPLKKINQYLKSFFQNLHKKLFF